MLIFNAIIDTLKDFIIILIFTLLFNYLISKDFRKLTHKIKKIALSTRKSKIKAINQQIYNYFFVD